MARRGNRDDRRSHSRNGDDRIRDRMRLAFQLERADVQLLREKSSAADPQKIVATLAVWSIKGVVFVNQQQYALGRVGERRCIDTGILGLVTTGEIQKMASGKYLGRTVGTLCTRFVQLR